MAKQLYDYWFMQFDFPDENGKPYKSSGGKMIWNKKLKREIPEGWDCGNLFEIATFTNGFACQKFRPKDGEVPLPVIKIREMHNGISSDTEEVSPNIPESVKVYNGDVSRNFVENARHRFLSVHSLGEEEARLVA